ncbi:NAD(P)/FAD-dependent oxidoreductase [Sulfitobacter sp.]|uniref:NAD(P)/FAD-dependent oxidoreductase n=1 Tax=Sulfitobacter sp. TaxID=1903071 RepID=UPI0030035BAE
MTEITIRGAGIFGLSVAWVCCQRGARVQVIDPHGPAAGSSGGIVGALAPHVPENWNSKKAFQLESLLMAEEFWADIAAVGGKNPGYSRSGRLQPIADPAARALAERRAGTARDLWHVHATWEVIPAPQGDWQPNSPDGHLIRDTLSAHLHPRQACDALVAALRSHGVEVVPEAADKGAVLWATGVAGLEALNLGRPRSVGNGVKGQAALLRYDAAGAPQLFASGVHVIPHLDGTVAIGSTSERDYDDPASTDAQLDDVVAAARAAVPALKSAPVIARWAGVRPRARSRAPMLGTWPERAGHFIANGGFKIGFGMAPKVAHVMADLLLDGIDAIPDGFRVEDSL